MRESQVSHEGDTERPTTRTSRTTAKKADEPKAAPQTPETAQEALKPEGPRGRYTPEQRTAILEQAQKMVDGGASWQAVAETLGVRPDNLRRWRQPGQSSRTPAQQVRKLERENERLRQAVASLATRVADLEIAGAGESADLISRQRAALSEMALKVVELEIS